MPKWIHDRAMELKKEMKDTYGPEKAEQVAFAVATQQSHKLGKSPKTFVSKQTGKREPFGTAEGREVAKAKFNKPRSEYKKTAADVMFTSMMEELEKIAVRWKDALRTGEIGAAARSRLRQVGLLDYGREGAGLARGNAELARKMNVPIEEVKGFKQDLKELGLITMEARAKNTPESKALAKQRLAEFQWNQQLRDATSRGGLASVHYPMRGGVVVTNKKGKVLTSGLSPENQEQIKALSIRHELDELRIRNKMGKRKKYLPVSPPKNFYERVVAKNLSPDDRVNLINKIVEKSPDKWKDKMRNIPLPATPKKGYFLRGNHSSPEVILRESQNVATLSPEVAHRMKTHRVGEEYTMGPLGFEYGKSSKPEARKAILESFRKGEI